MRRGDPVRSWTDEYDADRLDPCDQVVDAARCLRLAVPFKETYASTLPFGGHPLLARRLWDLGVYAADIAGTDYPIGVLVHHNVQLGWHKDRQAPPHSRNLTVMLRDDDLFDLLVVGQTAWRMRDRAWLLFDNQTWHGTAQYTVTQSRLAVTFYVPA